MSETVVIDRRFRGPPESGNGGYSCAMVARAIRGPAEVTLRSPPPLGRQLAVQRRGEAAVLLDGERLVAEARSAGVAVSVPAPVPFEEAQRASTRYPWREGHPYPTCFVCGPGRDEGDGLRIFAGPTDDAALFAAPWVPGAALADADGRVRDEFAWAALDCPSGIVTTLLGDVDRILLGRLAAELRRPLFAGRPYVVQSWPLGRDGRKRHSASALHTADGELCAVAQAVWFDVPPHG